MNINVKIDGLTEFTEAIALLGSSIAHHNGMENTEKALKKLATATEEVKEEVKDEVKEEVKEEVKKSNITLEDVRALFVSKNSPGSREKLKGILDKYGADNVSSLEEKDFEHVIKDLQEI